KNSRRAVLAPAAEQAKTAGLALDQQRLLIEGHAHHGQLLVRLQRGEDFSFGPGAKVWVPHVLLLNRAGNRQRQLAELMVGHAWRRERISIAVGAPAPVPKVSVGGVSLVIGGLFFALVSGWIVITRPATVADHVRRGWTLLPVAVAARDLSPSTGITITEV